MTYNFVVVIHHSTTLDVPYVRAAKNDKTHFTNNLQDYLYHGRYHEIAAL